MHRDKIKICIAILILGMFLVPPASAHWINGAGTPGGWTGAPGAPGTTHEHTVIGGTDTTAGYFGQRICQDPITGELYFSNDKGVCPPDTIPFIPPLRGVTTGFPNLGCWDTTLPIDGTYNVGPAAQGTYFKTNPHVGPGANTQYVVDNGDVNDYFQSGTRGAAVVTGSQGFDPGYGGAGLAHWGNGIQSTTSITGLPTAALRYIAGDGNPGPVAARNVIHGNDQWGPEPSPAAEHPAGPYPAATNDIDRAIHRPNRLGTQASPGSDFGDNDWEVGFGSFCFTYAIDSNPGAMGQAPNGLGQPTFADLMPGAGPDDDEYDDCQEDLAAGLNNAQVPLSRGGPGAPGVEHNKAFGGGCWTTNAAALFPCAGADWNDPIEAATTFNIRLKYEFNAHAIGSDGTYDTTTIAPLVTCGALNNVDSAHTVDGLAGPSLQSSTVGIYANGRTNAIPAPMPGVVPNRGVMLAQYVGTIDFPTYLPGVKVPTVRPIPYGVCNNVAEEGCTNIPVESAANGGTLGVNDSWQGHVYASLQQCEYVNTIPAQAINNGHDYNGYAVPWGDGGKGAPPITPCWPERLCWSSVLNVWAPKSQGTVPTLLGAIDGAVLPPPPGAGRTVNCPSWEPDNAPATARDIEYIEGTVQRADARILPGGSVCPAFGGPFTLDTMAAWILANCGPGTITEPQLPTQGWSYGLAAVFTP